MAWKSARRERILIWGPSGAGKTMCAIGLMEFARLTRTQSFFWIIDNDNQMEATGVVEGGEYEHLVDMCQIWVPGSFDEYGPITDEILRNAGPEDWVVVDMISNVYRDLPDWWQERVYPERDSHTYWSTVRREIVEAQQEAESRGEKGRGHEKQFGGTAGVDWQFIGKEYRKWEKKLSINAPCHVIALAGEQEIEERFDKGGVRRAAFSMTSGVAPKGEKDMVHRFHSNMRMGYILGRDGKTVSGRQLTVHRDRGRMGKWEELGGRGRTIELTPDKPKFGQEYLVAVGGWKLVGG